MPPRPVIAGRRSGALGAAPPTRRELSERGSAVRCLAVASSSASCASSPASSPPGRKHLGNYIGAIRQYVEGQDRGDPAIYCIVDLHAITVAYEPVRAARARCYDTTAILIAAGLDPERCILFRQADVTSTPSCAGCCRR